jgi:hypothetical protein
MTLFCKETPMRKLVLGLIAGSAAGLALTAAPQPARAQGLLGALLGLGSPTYGYGYGYGYSPYYGTGYSWGGQVSRYDPYSSYGYGYGGYPYGSPVGSQVVTYGAGYGYPYGYSDSGYWMSGKGTKRQKRKAHR